MKFLSSIGLGSMLIAPVVLASVSFVGAATRVLVKESFDGAQPDGLFQPDDRDYRLTGTDTPGWRFRVRPNAGHGCGIFPVGGPNRRPERTADGSGQSGYVYWLTAGLAVPVDMHRTSRITMSATWCPTRIQQGNTITLFLNAGDSTDNRLSVTLRAWPDGLSAQYEVRKDGKSHIRKADVASGTELQAQCPYRVTCAFATENRRTIVSLDIADHTSGESICTDETTIACAVLDPLSRCEIRFGREAAAWVDDFKVEVDGLAEARVVAGKHPQGVLIADGCAHATIVLGAQCSRAEERTAWDLQEVFHDITGIALPIKRDNEKIAGNRILVGQTQFTEAVVPTEERRSLGEEGYIVRVVGRDLVLVGGGPYGTIYAAAEVYDRLGARWYMPGELGVCLPKLDTIRFEPFDVRREPSFKMRWIGGTEKWQLRNRVNRIRSPFLPPAFTVYPGIYHSQNRWVPTSLHATHPEYFALVNGERLRNPKVHKLCNSNAELPQVIADAMANALREVPGIDLLSLSPTDGQFWCECPHCRREDDDAVSPNSKSVPSEQRYSRRQMVLYNRVAAEMEKQFPDQRLLVGAYSTYTLPPQDTTIRVHRNLAVVICRFSTAIADLAHPVRDQSTAPSRRYHNLINSWRDQTSHIYFYEYYNKHNWLDLPWPIVHTIAEDVPFFESLGVEGLHSQYANGNIWSNFLPQYVAARLLWDHTANVPEMMDEFYRKFYGQAAAPMKCYHELLEETMASCSQAVAGGAITRSHLIFTEEVVAEMWKHLHKAQASATDDLVKRRLEKIHVMTEYTDRLSRGFRLKHQARQAEGRTGLELLKQAYVLADALRDDLIARRAYYHDVATGKYFTKNLAMHRTLNAWREELVEAGVLDPKQYPDKGGGGNPWD